MKKTLLFLFFFSFTIKAQEVFPDHLISHKQILPTLFQSLRSYIYLLEQNSRIQTTQNGCKIYHYYDHQHHKKFELKVCIKREILKNKIIEKLLYSSKNQKRVHFILKREGKNLKETSNTDLLSFNFPTPDSEDLYFFSAPQMKFSFKSAIANKKRQSLLYYDYGSFKLRIKEKLEIINPYRIYDCSQCGDENFMAMVKLKSKNFEFQYFWDNFFEPVAPFFFNQSISSLASGLQVGGEGIKMALIFSYQWPPVGVQITYD